MKGNIMYLNRIILLFLFCISISNAKPENNEQYLRQLYHDVLNKPENVKKRVEDAMHKYFKNPEFMEVEFFPTPQAKIARGYFSRIEITLKGTKIKVLKIKDGWFSLRGITLDLKKLYKDNLIRVKKVEDTKMDVTILEEDLNKAIFEKNLPIKNPRLTIENRRLSFKGSFKTLFFKSHVDTKGRLEVKNKTEIYFYPDRLKLNSLPIPGFLKRTLSSKINPIIDLNDFSFITKIDEIKLQNRKLQIISK
jgi:hypothetical protein